MNLAANLKLTLWFIISLISVKGKARLVDTLAMAYDSENYFLVFIDFSVQKLE